MKKKTIKNIIFSLLTQIICIICGFVIPKLMIQKYGSETYGLVTSITQFLAYITLFESGIGLVTKSALYKAIASKNKKEISSILHYTQKFFNKIILIFAFYIVVLCFIYPNFESASNFDSFFTISLIIIISISCMFEYFIGMTYKLYLQADQKNYIVSYIQIITYILNTISIFILINLNCDIRIVKLVSSVIFISRPIIQSIYVKKKLKLNLKEYDENYKLIGQKHGLSQHIAGVINTNIDVVLLTIFTPLINVSIYSVYNLIISQIRTLINGFTVGTDAFFGDLYAKGEKEKLNKYFNIYETIYIFIVTVIFSCCMILIVPFIKVYTSGINDANYIQKLFAILFVFSGLMACIKSPYNSLVHNAGKFKETENGAWIEMTINVVVSIIMVNKYGLIGVIFGTLLATTFRGIEFLMYASKKILERKCIISIKKIIVSIMVTTLVYFIGYKFMFEGINSYLDWIKYGFLGFLITILITFLFNLIFINKEIKETIIFLKEVKK